MRSLEECIQQWQQLDDFKTLSELKDAVKRDPDAETSAPGLRSVHWKIFLLFESLHRETWKTVQDESRSAYVSLRTHFLRAIEHPDELESSIDPLSDTDESPWIALRQDETLRAEILQDVERCMPENYYFRQPSTQSMLLDILFIFCKLNPDVGYRQGMHEILAPILWVVERDAIDAESKPITGNDSALMLSVLDNRYIEHDTFTLFGLVMQNAKSFYETAPASQQPASKRNSRSAPVAESPIILRCGKIMESYLPKVDPGLAAHLKGIGILPQIFLLRWIRLLFGREFPFDDLLDMWDVIFAEDPSLDIVDLICIAMILRVRWQLIEADHNTALTLLMRYSDSTEDTKAQTFVQDALFLKQNIHADGGSELIVKHSGRPPPLVNRLQHPPTTPRRQSTQAHQRTRSPLSSPSKFIAQSGGLESLLQDAARGVYTRGEKWGVNKAVRDAVGEVRKNVQNLQASRSPSRYGGLAQQIRSSTPTGVSTAPPDVSRKMKDFEERNKALAKMLEGAVSQLWEHQKEASAAKSDEDDSLKALGMAIAKVQFVQIYLEDSSIPLPAEEITKPEEAEAKPEVPPKDEPQAPQAEVLFAHSDEEDGATSATEETNAEAEKADTPQPPKTQPTVTAATQDLPETLKPAPQETPQAPSTDSMKIPQRPQDPQEPPQPHSGSPFQQPRPTLASSSFSWMLGQDGQRQSSFLSASHFPPEVKRSGVDPKEGFLFGIPGGADADAIEEVKAKSRSRGSGRGKDTEARKEGRREVVDASDEVFDLSTL